MADAVVVDAAVVALTAHALVVTHALVAAAEMIAVAETVKAEGLMVVSKVKDVVPIPPDEESDKLILKNPA